MIMSPNIFTHMLDHNVSYRARPTGRIEGQGVPYLQGPRRCPAFFLVDLPCGGSSRAQTRSAAGTSAPRPRTAAARASRAAAAAAGRQRGQQVRVGASQAGVCQKSKNARPKRLRCPPKMPRDALHGAPQPYTAL